MPRDVIDEEGDDDDDPGIEAAEFDAAGADDLPTVACPNCGWQIPEDAPRCPYCETYVSDEDAPPRRQPWWIVIGVVACLYIVYRWIVG